MQKTRKNLWTINNFLLKMEGICKNSIGFVIYNLDLFGVLPFFT